MSKNKKRKVKKKKLPFIHVVTDRELIELTSGIEKVNPVQMTGTVSNVDEEIFKI